MMSFGGNSIPKMIAVALLIAVSLSSRKTYDYNLMKRFLNPLFIFALILLVPYLYNYNEYISTFTSLSSVLLNILFFWFIGNMVVRNPILAYRMILFFIIGIFFSSILFLLDVGIDYEEGRMTIFGENQNKIGIFSALAVLYILSTVFENYRGYKNRRLFLILFLIPLINMIAETGSRVTFIGLMLSLLIFILLRQSGNSIKKIAFILAGGIVLYLLFDYFMSFEIMRDRLMNTYEDQDLAGRDRIWELLWPLFKSSPVFGVGIGGYAEYATLVFGQLRSPHNVFVEVLVYSGLAGFTAFMFFLFRIFRDGMKIFTEQRFAFPLLTFMFLMMVFMTGQGLNVKSFWMIFLYVVSVKYNIDMIKQREIAMQQSQLKTELIGNPT